MLPNNEYQMCDIPFNIYEYRKIDNIETLIIYTDNDLLLFIDVEARKKYHEIQLLNDRILHSFEYINKDSILLLYDNPNNFAEVPDSLKFSGLTLKDTLKFQLIDYNGNIKKYYHFNCDLSNFEGTDYKIEEVLPPYTFLYYETIKRVDNIVFFFPAKYGYFNFDTINNNSPLIAYYDLKTEKFIFSKKLKLPYLKDKMYYPSNHDVLNFCISANGLPLLRFFYSSDVFEWDYKNDKIITYKLKSKLIDTIPPLQNYKNDMEATIARYSSIYYDKNNKLYYSILRLSSNYFTNNYWSIIIADENLKYINEIINPKHPSNFSFFENNIIAAGKLTDDSLYVVKSKMGLSNYNLKKDFLKTKKIIDDELKEYKKNVDKYINDKIKNPLINFIKEKAIINDSNYCVITIYAQDGCISCNQQILTFIAHNSKIFSEVPLYVILTGDKNSIDKEINGINFNPFNKIILDDKSIIKQFPIQSSINNPRLTIVKDNFVVLDSIYSSFEIESSYIPSLLDGCGLIFQQ